MTLDHFRPHVQDYIRPFITLAVRMGITPNALTVASLIVAILAGISFYLGMIIWGVVMVAFNAFFDALDGALARETNSHSLKGDFLDHVVDRYADIFIITGIFAGGFAPWWIGVFALTGVLMSSYLGTQAQAVGLGRNYGGVLGRADRLVLILAAGVLDIFINGGILGMDYLGWLLLIFGVMGHLTAIQRFAFAWNRMK